MWCGIIDLVMIHYRLCHLCDSNDIGEEFHYIMACNRDVYNYLNKFREFFLYNNVISWKELFEFKNICIHLRIIRQVLLFILLSLLKKLHAII
jgi:hypothetical protein